MMYKSRLKPIDIWVAFAIDEKLDDRRKLARLIKQYRDIFSNI